MFAFSYPCIQRVYAGKKMLRKNYSFCGDLSLTVTSRNVVVLLQQQTADSVQDFSLESHFLQQLPPGRAEVCGSYHLRKRAFVRF